MASADLRVEDLHGVLALLGEIHETTGAPQFADVLMRSLASVVPCDLISYNEIDLQHGATSTFFEPVLTPRPELEAAFVRTVEQHPLVQDMVATGDPRPRRMSDFIALPALRRLDLYHEVFRPLETNHQLGFSLSSTDGVVIGIGLNRQRLDFTDRDIAIMDLLRPHLAAGYEHAVLRAEHADRTSSSTRTSPTNRSGRGESDELLESLTAREREVALLVAGGHSNRRIARMLFIAERTAEKHVANLLRKTGLGSRAALAATVARAVAVDDR